MNLEASTLRKGAPASRAKRRAISVFPTPVVPMRIRLLGAISCLISSSTRCRRHRLRSTMATDFLASSWPTMYLSSSVTICLGVSSSSHIESLDSSSTVVDMALSWCSSTLLVMLFLPRQHPARVRQSHYSCKYKFPMKFRAPAEPHPVHQDQRNP